MAPLSKTIYKTKKAAGARPYNRYNIFFILERERLILGKGGSTKWSVSTSDGAGPQSILQVQSIPQEFKNLNLPPLPSRFAHLYVPECWCIPGISAKKRAHRRTHGVATFRELARLIASSWKAIDSETLEFCSAVEKVLKTRYMLLSKANGGPSKPCKAKGTAKSNAKGGPSKLSKAKTAMKQIKQAQVTKVAKSIATPIITKKNLAIRSDKAMGVYRAAISQTKNNTAPATLAVIQEILRDFRKDSPPIVNGSKFYWDKNEDAEMFGEINKGQTSDDITSFITSIGTQDLACGPCVPSTSNMMVQIDPVHSNWTYVNNHFGILPYASSSNIMTQATLLSTASNDFSTTAALPFASNINAKDDQLDNQWAVSALPLANVSDDEIRMMWHSDNYK